MRRRYELLGSKALNLLDCHFRDGSCSLGSTLRLAWANNSGARLTRAHPGISHMRKQSTALKEMLVVIFFSVFCFVAIGINVIIENHFGFGWQYLVSLIPASFGTMAIIRGVRSFFYE